MSPSCFTLLLEVVMKVYPCVGEGNIGFTFLKEDYVGWNCYCSSHLGNFFFFELYCGTCRILVPGPGIEPGPSIVKAWNPNTGLPGNSPSLEI